MGRHANLEGSLRVGIAGATGLVGRELCRLIEERRFPAAEVRLFASQRSAGSSVDFGGNKLRVELLEDCDPADLDLLFFSAGAEVSRQQAPRFAEAGVYVIDNSSAFRADPEVPLVVPEVNGDLLESSSTRLIANPNCTTIIMLVALAPIERRYGLQEIVVSTYQAVSGAGWRALEEMYAQARQFASGEPLRFEFYDRPILFNLIPWIGELDGEGWCREERKMLDETRKILGRPDLRVCATTVRVPVERCHSESIWVRLREQADPRELRTLLQEAPGVEMDELPTPDRVSETFTVRVGRIRATGERGIALWVVGDQLWKGAALNAIQIAERLIEAGRL